MKIFSKKSNRSNRRQSSDVRTPSAQEANFQYYKKQNINTSQSVRSSNKKSTQSKRAKQNFIKNIPALLLCLVVLVSVIYLSTVDVRVKVNMLNGDSRDSTVSLRDESAYQQAAQQYLSQSVVNRSKFLVDVNGLSDHLRKEFPELAAVSITVPLMGRRPVVELQTTAPAFILSTKRSSMLIGNNGTALIDTKDVNNSGRFNLRTVSDESGLELTPGKAALPEAQSQFISIIVEQLEKQGYVVDVITIPPSVYDLHVRLREKPYYIKFNINEDPLQQVGSYVAVERQVESEIKEYIDVRVGERVFYR